MLKSVQSLLLLGVLASVSLHAQAPPRPASWTSTGSRVMSPAVATTWIAEHGQAGARELELLVLWRGRSGWFLEGGHNGGSGSSTWEVVSAGGSGGSRETVEQQVFLGGLTLNLRFDRLTRTAWVQDREVSLQNANVILVDRVDSREGLTVVGTREIDPQLSGVPVRIEQVLRRSSELVAFLRCDASLPDPLAQEMVRMVCGELLNR